MGYPLSKWTLVVTLLVNAVHVQCFLPVLGPNTPPETYSHVQITMEGVQGAVANFLKDNELVQGTFLNSKEVLEEFFKDDNDNREKFDMRVMDIATRMNNVQRDFKGTAKYTVNGEQIEEAYNLLKMLSANIRKLTSVDPLDQGAQETVLTRLATALLVIQSFYSSTNWVEMNSNIYSPAFGGEGDLPKIEKKIKDTCIDCETTCRNNIITQHLTSGFRPDQGIVIPSLQRGRKCSHYWNTRDEGLAFGGIGKDTSAPDLSPHAEYHEEAAEAAMDATTAYLYQNGKGVLSGLSVENFKRLLNLKSMEEMPHTSLTFVMDVTGSMGDDIMAARKSAIEMVTSVQGTPNEPEDYILATFSDPENLTSGERFSNADQMIDQLNSLVAKGGGDTPEYSMSGLLKGIAMSKNGSMLYMFTDAPAKDPERAGEVTALAKAKSIKICPFYTSSSGGMDKVYTQIATTSGCEVHEIPKAELNKMLSAMLKEHMPSSLIMMKTFQMSQNESDRTGVFVDQTTDLLKIEATGASSVADIAVEDSNGFPLQYEAGVASRYYVDGKVIISVQKPIIGEWKVIRNTEKPLAVQVTGSSSFDFTFQFTEQDENGVSYIIVGNPIAGFNYTISTQMLHLDHKASLQSISLVDLSGSEIQRLKTSLREIGAEMFAVADFTMPPESFRVQISGVLPGGQTFQRMNQRVTSPVDVKLRLPTYLGPFPFNEPQNIKYELDYHGLTNQTFTVTIDFDSEGLSTETFTQSPGEFSEYYFQVIGQPTSEIQTFHVSVRKAGSDIVLQSLSTTLWFQDPDCDVIYNEGECPEAVQPPASCQSITWFSRAVFSPEVTSHEISSTNTKNVEIVEDYTTDDGKRYINVSGDCCSPSVYLSALGSSGYLIGQCHFDFGQFPTVTNVTKVEALQSDSTSDIDRTSVKLLVIIGATVCLLVATM